MNIILFPGSFSPFTDGHFSLILRYLLEAENQGMKIDQVKILMSMKERDGINPKTVCTFLSLVYSNDKRIKVVACKQSPVREVYEEVGNTDNNRNTYILARSSKDDDQVVSDFYRNFSKGGKYWYEGCKVVDLHVNNAPLVYKGRKDKHNGEPVSGTIAREDIKNDDFESFKTSYRLIMKQTTVKPKHIKQYFEALKK